MICYLKNCGCGDVCQFGGTKQDSAPTPAPREPAAREWVAALQKKYGYCCGDVIHLFADDLEMEALVAVLREIMRGKSNQQIASELGITLYCTKNFVNSIYKSLRIGRLSHLFPLVPIIRHELE